MLRSLRQVLWITTLLGGMAPGATPASADVMDDCIKFSGAAAFAPCSAMIDDKKLQPGRRAYALILRARAAIDSDQRDRAEADLRAAFTMSPPIPFGYRVRARLRGLQGRNTEARADLTKAIQLSDNQANKYVSYIDRGNFFLRILELQSAMVDYEMAIGLDPTKAAAYVAHALANKAQGKAGEALVDLDRAAAVEPAHWQTYVERGDILASEKRFREAIAAYDYALAIRGNDARAMRGRAAANALLAAEKVSSSPSPTAPTSPKVATPSVQTTGPAPIPAPGGPSPTVTTPTTTVPKAVPLSPATPSPASAPIPAISTPVPSPQLPVKPAEPSVRRPETPAAAPSPSAPVTPPATPVMTPSAPPPVTATPSAPTESAKQAPASQPSSAPTSSPAPSTTGQSGDAADQAAKQVEERRNKLKEALELRQKGKPNEALAIYNELLRRVPGDDEAAIEKARTMIMTSQWKLALDTLKPVLESKTATPALRAMALESQGEVLARNSEPEAAIRSLTAALQINARLVSSLYWRGYALLAIGGFDKSLADFRQAGQISTNSTFYLGWEAIALVSLGDVTKAKEVIDRALTAQSDNATALSARARLRLLAGDLSGATADLDGLASRGLLGPFSLQTQQLIMLSQIFKPTDQPVTKQ